MSHAGSWPAWGTPVRVTGRPLALTLGLLQTTRVPTALLIGCAVWVPSRWAGDGGPMGAAPALVFALAAMAGFALNDYCDVERDRVNHPHRAIPSGRLSPWVALVAGIVLLLGATAAAVYAGGGPLQLGLFTLTLAGVLHYNAFTARAPQLKSLYSAALSTMPVLYITLVLGYDRVYWLVPGASLLFLVGRELLMDVRDLRGDRRAGLVTLPMRLGPGRTSRVAFLLEFSATALLLPLLLLVPSVRTVLSFTAIVAAVAGACLTWRAHRRWSRRLAVYLLWLPLLAGIVMLLRSPG
jgi:geranylgeranylglycerol-phosphate geranylgeranyltransferase